MFKIIFFYFLSFLVGLVFIAGALLKINSIESFELSFVDTGFIGWQIAPFLARLLIGIEFLVGFVFLLHLFYWKHTFNFCYLLISFFIAYLLIKMILHGNDSNCGCFGEAIKFTPLQAIIKNVILLVIIYFIKLFHKGINYGKYAKDILFVIAILGVALPFILNPISLKYSESFLNKPKEGYILKMELLYENAILNVPPKSLSKGKHVIAFMSLTCEHCRLATKKMRIIHERNPEISFYFVLNGKESDLEDYFNDTRAKDIPHCMLLGQPFISLASLDLPQIYLVEDAKVEYSIDYYSMDEDAILKWYNQEKSE